MPNALSNLPYILVYAVIRLGAQVNEIEARRRAIEEANSSASLNFVTTDRTLRHLCQHYAGQYIVAVQDPVVRAVLRKLPGVPVRLSLAFPTVSTNPTPLDDALHLLCLVCFQRPTARGPAARGQER